MFTAEEYRTAAKVLDSTKPWDKSPAATLRDEFQCMAEKLDDRDAAAYAIGSYAQLLAQSWDATSLGLKIFAALLNVGWTPPEGLF